MTRRNTMDDIFGKVDMTDPDQCWLWMARLDAKGYGHLNMDGTNHRAHRFFYERLRGEIPEGLELDHLCRVRNCVNPKHLEPVTRHENSLRADVPWAVVARDDRCLNGHELTPDNYSTGTKGRRRMCKTCNRERNRLRWQRIKEAAAGEPGGLAQPPEDKSGGGVND